MICTDWYTESQEKILRWSSAKGTMTNKTAYTVLFFSYPIYTAKPPPLASFSQCTISQKKKADACRPFLLSSVYIISQF